MVPLVLGIVVAAGPIASLLNPINPNAHCVHANVVAITGDMLRVFAPQALLYGLSVVLYGLLQSYRRFAAPSIGPGISSLVLIACYLAFVPLNNGRPLAQLPLSAELVLSVGTTLGIAALVVVALPPTWRLHLRFRPALRFPPGVARRAGGLALVGVIELIAIDLANVVIITLANGHGKTGAIVLFNYASQVFNSIAAILALSIVVSAFPVLSAREGPDFERTSAGSTRAVLLMSWLGTAVIAAIAVPAAHVLAKQPDQVSQLIWAFVLFALGHRGYRGDREPVAGDVRHRAAQGRRRGAGRKLADRDRGRRGAGPAGSGPPGARRRWPWASPSARPSWPSRWCSSPGGSAARLPCRVPATRRWPGWSPARQAPRWAWPSAWRCPCITSWWPSPWRCPRLAARSSRSASSRTSSTTVT